jgi:hypothetical protein
MFLYRRQGPKKRPKSGTPRKGRNPQKGLPNSARDLLPLIQPATKALAQMLAGRTASSGQWGHARAVLAQTERLVSERAHNRLNPAEREEFFEQIARLKLTLSDAESEAEFQAAEDQTPTPPPVPVDRERLKAMALSLTTSSAPDESKSSDRFEGSNGEATVLNEDPASSAQTDRAQEHPDDADGSEDAEAAFESASKRSNDPNQLRLPRETADKLTLRPGTVTVDGVDRRRKPKLSASPRSKTSSQPVAKRDDKTGQSSSDAAEAPGAAKATKQAGGQKLPKGWIIDDEGFVVPGPG